MLRWTMLLLTGAFMATTPAQADENAEPAKPASAAPVKSEGVVKSEGTVKSEGAVKSEGVVPAKPRPRVYRAQRQLPPGLPRAGYKYRTTVTPATRHRARVVYETDQDLLLTPAYGPTGYIKNLPGTPILPGSSTIPGYYGRAFSYDYQGPYYGGRYEGYYWRLPYACGTYGYC